MTTVAQTTGSAAAFPRRLKMAIAGIGQGGGGMLPAMASMPQLQLVASAPTSIHSPASVFRLVIPGRACLSQRRGTLPRPRSRSRLGVQPQPFSLRARRRGTATRQARGRREADGGLA